MEASPAQAPPEALAESSRPADPPSAVAGLLAAAGGAVLVLSTFLVWLSGSRSAIPEAGKAGLRARLPGAGGLPGPGGGFGGKGPAFKGRQVSARGIITVSGKVALAMGIVLVVAGLVLWLRSNWDLRRVMAVVALVAGTVAASFVLARMTTVINQADVAARAVRVQTTRTLEPGIYLALLGGVAGATGGLLGVFTLPPPIDRRRHPARPLGPPPTAPLPAEPPAGSPPTAPLAAEPEAVTEVLRPQAPTTELPRPDANANDATAIDPRSSPPGQ